MPHAVPFGTLFPASQRRLFAYIFLQKLPAVCLKSGNNNVFQNRVPEFAILCNLM
jgi:hypothetical protein